ncbi:hypothetical protein J8I26_19400 [Herbaspirillum sp. LeCh32-8]|nr:hypothetical protein [Herbaspirillum sp. LeCh32-8]
MSARAFRLIGGLGMTFDYTDVETNIAVDTVDAVMVHLLPLMRLLPLML